MPPASELTRNLSLLGGLCVPGLVGSGQSRSWTSNPTHPLATSLCVGHKLHGDTWSPDCPCMCSARISPLGRGLEAKREEVTERL